MAKTEMSSAQLECNAKVSGRFFSGVGNSCTPENLTTLINRLMKELPDDYVYVGVTHHPCGRFSGKDGTTPLPNHFRFIKEYYTEDALITERLHNEDYDMMYLICYTDNKARAFFYETSAIKIARSIDNARVLNGTAGGNGNMPESDYYWVYICTTKTKPLHG